MGKSKGFSYLWLQTVSMAEENKESVITASIFIYAALYMVMSIGGMSFLSEPAWAPYVNTQSNSDAPSGAVWVEGTDMHWADGSTEYTGRGEWLIGEAGTFTTSDGNWQTITFERDYQNPVVVGSVNSREGGDDALIFESRNVQSNQAEMRACEDEDVGSSGCDGHTSESVGYMVVDAAATSEIPGIEAGTFSISGQLDSTTKTVSFSESFGSTPNVFINTQTTNNNVPISGRLTSKSTSSFTAGKCWQDSTDGCDGNHGTETFGYVALEPGNIPFNEEATMGVVSVSDSNWNSVSYSSSVTPAAIVSTQTVNGGQDATIDEAKAVTGSSMDVRYCEYDGGGNCDGHAAEDVAWLAIQPGLLTVSPVPSSGPQGAAWVDDKYLYWIDQNGDKARFHGNPTGNSPSGASAGSAWVENNYIHYIDEYGEERTIS